MPGSTKLEGKTALITGGAQRLGREICILLANSGVNIVVHYNKSGEEATAAADAVRATGVDAWTVCADFQFPQQAESLVDEAWKQCGVLDFVINNASIFPSDALREMSEESLSKSISVNALSPFLIGRAFAARDREGCIINLLDARVVDYDIEHVSYHLSKRLLFSMTRMMASEFAPKVRVNAVAPGLILPPQGEDESYLHDRVHTNPLAKFGSPEDVAETIAFLLGSDFITGQVVYVDGGRHMRGNFYG